MGFRQDWDALAVRIDGLAQAGLFVVQTAAAVGSDYYGVLNSVVLPNATETFALLARFHETHQLALPPAAARALKQFIELQGKFFRDGKASGFPALQGMIALLQSIRAEVTHHLTDLEFAQHRRVERAFEHLKRSLIVDEQLAARWTAAFDKHETHCEKLGAVHLLAHGLWAFKASEAGAATDLLLGSPLETDDHVDAVAEALVLTEWKRVTDAKDLSAHAAKARSQAAKYAAGILGGVELRSFRYLVFVSERDLVMPKDIADGAVVYRHINIPVTAKPPSAS
ncbi:MAG: hypothetical protein INH41_15480 [Myxococcaceae bacterium]|nr:hypothetical protein [Myxococcaceae bacterium]